MKAPTTALDQALKWLANRAHSRLELRQKLRSKAAPERVEEIIRELSRRGYLHDATFAVERALARRRLKHWGNYRIALELKRLGICQDDIRKALEQTNQELDESAALQVVRQRWEKRWGPPDQLQAVKKLYDHCLRLGYFPERVRSFLDSLLLKLEKPTGRG